MSKTAILAIGNFNLFKANPKEGQEHPKFQVDKETKVNADYSFYDKEKGIDVRGIRVSGNAAEGKKPYIRISISIKEGDKRSYINGALFASEKKTENQPEMTGTLNIGEDKLRLAAWKKTGAKAGDFLSIRVSEYQKSEAAQPEPEPAKQPATTADDDDDTTFPF